MRRKIAVLLFLFLLGAVDSGWTASSAPPSWVYDAFATLHAAGLFPEYPAAAIDAGSSLSRYECAFYLRLLLLRLGKEGDKDPWPTSGPVATAFSRLVEEFTPELGALGIQVQVWPPEEEGDQSVYFDLDTILAGLDRPTEGPGEKPPDLQDAGGSPINATDPSLNITSTANTYRTPRPESLNLPLTDFRKYPQSLLGLAGEVLGLEWSTEFSSDSATSILGSPLRLGGFI
ncbi:MAG: hypothetical protein GX493_00650, partial [Firmicutes bacterium]|nr:hypothetical protein [Bacillota bacterium]